MQTLENHRNYKQKIQILTENVFFSILNLPQTMERRVGRLLQKIRTQLGKEDLSKLDVFYLALEKGLAQMESWTETDMLNEQELQPRSGASVTDLSIVRSRNLLTKIETESSVKSEEVQSSTESRG